MRRGCPFGAIGNGLTEKDEFIRQDLSLIFEVVKNKLAAFFVREKAKGSIPPGEDAEALADYCIAILQGAMLMGKIKRSSQLVEKLVGEALNQVRRLAIAHPSVAPASPGSHPNLTFEVTSCRLTRSLSGKNPSGTTACEIRLMLAVRHSCGLRQIPSLSVHGKLSST
jgi:hypothetical protein